MGNFYVNFSVKGVGQLDVVSVLRELGADGYVGPAENDWCSFAESTTDTQDGSAIIALGTAVSLKLGKPVLCVFNHDDDILSVDLFANGEAVAEYNSCPGYFASDPTPEQLRPRLSNVEALANLGSVPPDDLREALMEEDAFALDLHGRIVEALSLPEYSVGFGYRYAQKGEFDDVGGIVHTVD
jgi:hypothetical protein